MKEDLHFENNVLSEALYRAESQKERLAAKNYNQELFIEALQERRRKDTHITRLLIAITALATGIVIQYQAKQREQENDAIYKGNLAELSEKAKQSSINDKRLKELAIRLEYANPGKRMQILTTPDDSPPDAEIETLKRGTFDDKVELLSKHFDSQYLQHLLSGKTGGKFVTNNQAEIPRDVTVTGSHELLSAPEVAQYLKGYPNAWITGNIVKVTLHNEKFGRASSYSNFGHVIGQFSRETKTIDVFGATITGENLTMFDRTIAHELAHSNDWISSDDLTVAERVDLLAKIYARIIAPDRYISAYVETVAASNTETSLAHRAEEYFAQISAAYFNNPTELNYKDYQIIHDLVSKKNPTFDIEEGKRSRVLSFNSYKML